MSIFTQTELLELREQWKAALKACATGKSYRIDDRELTRYDLDEIRRMLGWIEDQLAALSGRSASMLVRPRICR